MQKNVPLDVLPDKVKLGWIGLGVMGEPMCQHLLAAGYPMAVFTRSKEKASEVLGKGATWCASPAEVTKQSDVIFTMVGREQEVRDVYFAANGLFSEGLDNKLFIDMGTTAPTFTLQLAEYAIKLGAQFIDAPVSGGDVGARSANLSIMIGGEDSPVKKANVLLKYLGSATVMGGVGKGQHTKMCNQIVVAGTMIGVCEALVYAKNAGLNSEKLISAIRPGAAGCWSLDNLAPRIIKNDFTPGFMVEHFIKDLGIALKEAEAMDLQLPGLTLARTLYVKVRDLGHGRSGTQALLLALDAAVDTAVEDRGQVP